MTFNKRVNISPLIISRHYSNFKACRSDSIQAMKLTSKDYKMMQNAKK